MDANDASRIIKVIDGRIHRLTGSEATVETTWAEVCAISANGLFASAYLYGDADPSAGFRIPGTLAVSVGDKVKVAWNARGERWVAAVANAASHKKIEVDPNAGTIKVGDGTARPSILIADSSGAVVGVHDHDANYASLAHDHDADYSDIAHGHAHSSLSGIGADDHHARSHDHSSALDGNALTPSSVDVSSLLRMNGNNLGYFVETQIDVINNATTTTNIATTTTSEVTALPSGKVLYATGYLISRNSAGGPGGVVAAHHWDATTQALAYAEADNFNTCLFIVTTGGTNNRQMKYSVSQVSGTVQYYIRITGYWRLV